MTHVLPRCIIFFFGLKEEAGVMGDVAVTMRDPVFYRVHSYVDNLFYIFKDSLTPYSIQDVCIREF